MTSEQLHRGNAILNKMQAIENDLKILAEHAKIQQTKWVMTDRSGRPVSVSVPITMHQTIMDTLVLEKEKALKYLQSELESL